MASGGKSLRLMVEHWFAADPSKGIRVVEFRNRRSKHECYVRVEALTGTGPVAMFFFRHEDKTWRIYPPSRAKPILQAL
ncbi:hypothetical protein SAMN05445504_9232 [Burkholderia sp. CF099]|nr:hypothetical protein SAMN05445504_9232 [Burkholderia sp. CF099]